MSSSSPINFAADALHHDLVGRPHPPRADQLRHGYLRHLLGVDQLHLVRLAYDNDDVPYRIVVFVQMTGALVFAAGIERAFAERDIQDLRRRLCDHAAGAGGAMATRRPIPIPRIAQPHYGMPSVSTAGPDRPGCAWIFRERAHSWLIFVVLAICELAGAGVGRANAA